MLQVVMEERRRRGAAAEWQRNSGVRGGLGRMVPMALVFLAVAVVAPQVTANDYPPPCDSGLSAGRGGRRGGERWSGVAGIDTLCYEVQRRGGRRPRGPLVLECFVMPVSSRPKEVAAGKELAVIFSVTGKGTQEEEEEVKMD
ncbi:hypothetical protein E2C01_073139 [Portunus trituberculatus]|uniref:Uncharacterized protein n=1 Tax=Portunus trituberculatus TaxID=210409 RepID=A0A5B7I9T2_PORTR|nr:hypothetical protein [Portunus trituberculatus]